MLQKLATAFCRDASHALRAVATALILLAASTTTAVGADDIIIINYLPVSALQVTVAQLQPGHDGDPAEWQNYINQIETPAAGVGIGTQPTVQAKTDSGGKLANHFDGTYTYTFGTNIAAVTTPIAVPFVPTLTHRVTIALSSDTLPEAST